MVKAIEGFRSSYSDFAIRTELGPYVGDDLVIGRWVFHGVWEGGMPAAATAPAGTPVTFNGVDILRLEDGKIAEYWLADNALDVYARLGALRSQEGSS